MWRWLKRKWSYYKKVNDYRKFLKTDEDWDWAYILRLLQYKLERSRKCILSNEIVENAPQIAAQIREVEILLERVIENNYYEEISTDFHKKYGELEMIEDRANAAQHSVPVHFRFERETEEHSAEIRSEHYRLLELADQQQRDDLKKAFDLMTENIWGWWD